MARCAHIFGNDVRNIIELDPASDWRPDGGYVIASETAQIGWRYENGVFTDPTPPTEPPPRRPPSITAVQAELALLQTGLLDDIEAYIATLPRATQIRWRRMQVLERDDATLTEAWAARGGTPEQLDALFALGATL